MIPRLFDPEAAPEPCGELTVARVVGAYLEAKESHVAAGLIERTALDKARFYCLAFAKDFGSLPVSECRRGDLKRFLGLHPEYKSPWTKQDAVGHVVCCFRWAEDDGVVDRCPYRRPKDLPEAEPRADIRGGEVAKIIEHAKHWGHRPSRKRFRLALRFLWLTGVRTCEMYRFRWEQYDATRGVFELKAKRRMRLVVLPSRAWRLIRLLRLFDKRAEGHVFLTGRGTPWNRDNFGKMFRKHADRAGVRKEVSAYSTRHGFTVELLEQNAGERQVADLLGQSTTRYVKHYSKRLRTKVDYLRGVADRRKGDTGDG